MKLLGYLFLVILTLAAVGWFRGWFVVTAVKAGNKSSISVTVDKDTLDHDAQGAVAQLSRLSDKAATAVKSVARRVSADKSDLTGTVTEVEPKTRSFVVMVGAEAIALHAGDGVAITHGDAPATFDQLAPSSRVTLTFRHAGEQRSLSRIAVQL
ncbi:MAG: hypothetical protein ACI8UD_000187 [Planctomycetota bacterium]|jgi:hypothetical protein